MARKLKTDPKLAAKLFLKRLIGTRQEWNYAFWYLLSHAAIVVIGIQAAKALGILDSVLK